MPSGKTYHKMNPYPFFTQLAANNNRPWFQANRAAYDDIRAEWIAGIEQAKTIVAEEWPEIRHATPHTFRIYRDTRFSTDKTPYKTHIGSTLATPGPNDAHRCGVYIECGIPTTDSGVFAGLWEPPTPILRILRRAIVDNAEEWTDIVTDQRLNQYYPHWFGTRLKTAPQGWPKDHPMIEYLRLKSIGRFAPITPRQYADPAWPETIAERIIAAVPLLRFLDYSIAEANEKF